MELPAIWFRENLISKSLFSKWTYVFTQQAFIKILALFSHHHKRIKKEIMPHLKTPLLSSLNLGRNYGKWKKFRNWKQLSGLTVEGWLVPSFFPDAKNSIKWVSTNAKIFRESFEWLIMQHFRGNFECLQMVKISGVQKFSGRALSD